MFRPSIQVLIIEHSDHTGSDVLNLLLRRLSIQVLILEQSGCRFGQVCMFSQASLYRFGHA
jgi:hypothetical protein